VAFLREKDKTIIRTRFEELVSSVTIVNFTQEIECQYCRETRQLIEEVADLSEKIKLEVHNFQIDKEEAKKYSIDKIPATVIAGKKDYGIRLFGIPSGYEFGNLIEAVVMVSKGDSGLERETREALAELREPVHLQVFVTPT
jgi:glutaredoxin-like protein